MCVSPELLGQAREDEGGGATKAYEVPPELLVLARASKEKKAAARRAQQGAGAEHAEAPDSVSAEASTRITARPPASERAPSVIVAEEDLAPLSAVVSEPLQSAVVAAAPKVVVATAPKAVMAAAPKAASAPAEQVLQTPAVSRAGGRKRAARWLLITACAIAVCAGGVLGGKLLRDRQLLTITVPGIGLHF